MTKKKSGPAFETQRQKAHLQRVVEAGGKQLRLLLNAEEWGRFEALAEPMGGQKALLLAMVAMWENRSNAISNAELAALLKARLGV